ncbi:uncharacterized protein C8orf48 homolog [Zalophus californianus]|uniref:Uncharacterized protein C8orf48 homolog n=1 Tax=Zalophus californianus TaxID=9704 RepID=A0A6J2DBM1_ZALCA|nr:uncharacterized protein C8orf48 homolog [Zalophus californianus]XP_027952791.1 uncharacterized protein C8orf48-like [Eumetopias jubatus]XP_027952792.1 uncharacterized protein C8orf48-like [Eumetopias jubatus]
MADLSDETLTDEGQSSSSFSSSGGLPPWSHASGNGRTMHLEYRDKQSELSDYQNNENKFSRKWINYHKGKETNSGQYQSDTKLRTETTQVSDEELNALQSFCAVKINLIHRKANSKEKKRSRHQKPQLRLDAEASEKDTLNCTVPDELLNRIYLKNMRTIPKQVATAKQHISSWCPHCNRKRAELAQSAFLRQKKTLLESFLLQEKIDKHLYTKDFLTLIGDAHQEGFPRLSDDPRIIWKRLNEKSQIRYYGFERSDAEQMWQNEKSACHSPFLYYLTKPPTLSKQEIEFTNDNV